MGIEPGGALPGNPLTFFFDQRGTLGKCRLFPAPLLADNKKNTTAKSSAQPSGTSCTLNRYPMCCQEEKFVISRAKNTAQCYGTLFLLRLSSPEGVGIEHSGSCSSELHLRIRSA